MCIYVCSVTKNEPHLNRLKHVGKIKNIWVIYVFFPETVSSSPWTHVGSIEDIFPALQISKNSLILQDAADQKLKATKYFK